MRLTFAWIFRAACIAALALAWAIPTKAFAQSLDFSGGAWGGTESNEAAERRARDGLFNGFGPGRIETGPDSSSATAIPLKLGLNIPAGEGAVRLGYEYYTTDLDYDYSTLSAAGDIGYGGLEDYQTDNQQVEIGYRIPGETISVTPKIGRRWYSESFRVQESTLLSGGGIATQIGGDWSSEASGQYVGADFRIGLIEKLALRLSLEQSAGGLGGPHESNAFVASLGANASLTGLSLGLNSGRYEMEFRQYEIAIEYEAEEDIWLIAGVRQDLRTVRYPNYLGFTVATAGGSGAAGFSIAETLTDSFVYGAEERSTRGGVFAAIRARAEL